MDEFPANSNRARHPVSPQPQKKDAPKVERVVSAPAIQRKKSHSKRFKELFFGADIGNVGEYVVTDLLIPRMKETVVDMVTEAAERTFFGEPRSPSRRAAGRLGAGHTPYHNMSKPGILNRDPRSAPQQSRRARTMHDFNEIVLPSRPEAEEVLTRLIELVETYEVATVANLYDMVAIPPAFTDVKWGWTDLRDARTSRVRDGYLLDLPRPEPID